MLQVTRIVECHAHSERMACGARLEFRQYFADVFALGRENLGSTRVLGIIPEQVAVLFHVGAAPRGVRDDNLDFRAFECIDRPFCQLYRRGFLSGMYQKSSAARLLLRRNDFAPFGGEHARRGGIDLREKFALHAAQQQTYPAALRACGQRDFRDRFTGPELRKKRFHRSHLLRQQLQQTQPAHHGLYSEFLIYKQRHAHSPQAILPRKSFKPKPPVQLFSRRAFRLSFDLRARSFDEFSVVNTGRARRHASHAAQTAIEVAHPRRIHLRGTLARHLHQINPPARRIHFLPPQHIGGTHWQTKSAVHALFDDLVRRRMVRVEGARAFRFWCQFFHQMSPTNRPGFRVFFESSCFFTAFINVIASPAVPQASNASILSGRWRTTREPSRLCNSLRNTSSASRSDPALPSNRSQPIPVAYIRALHRS